MPEHIRPNSYRTDVAKLLEGFQQGVFQRNVSMDGEPGWAIKILPYIAAMGRLARGEYPPDGPGMPVAWVASHENGRVRHFAKADGWSVEAVLFEPSIPATGDRHE